MPHCLLRRVCEFDTDLSSNNMVLSNYEGKTNKHLGVIKVDVVVGTTTRLTLFVVVPAKVNFNLLLD